MYRRRATNSTHQWSKFPRNIARLAVAALVGACAATLCPAASADERVTPTQDRFYDDPADLASLPNGAIIRTRDIEVAQLQVPIPGITGRQILYKTTNTSGDPVVTTTTVLTAGEVARPRPLLSYQLFINGLSPECNPSYQLRGGAVMTFGNDIGQALLRGWAVSVPDFGGKTMAFDSYWMAAHAVLDGIRASKAVINQRNAHPNPDTPTVLMGASGGGFASLAAGEQQAAYAPEVKIAGISAAEPPSDLATVIHNVDGGLFEGNALYMLFAASREYPKVPFDSYLNDDGKKTLREGSRGQGCVVESLAKNAFRQIRSYTSVDVFTQQPIVAMLEDNKLGKSRLSVPTYIEEAVLDEVVPPALTDRLATKYCQDGTTLKYEHSLRGDHNTTGALWSVDAMSYLQDRVGNVPAPIACKK